LFDLSGTRMELLLFQKKTIAFQ